jgi:phosphoglycerate dehydrogenase-like enzyme
MAHSRDGQTMNSVSEPVEIAVLDDYQGVALAMADWSVLNGRARITVFRDHIADDRALVERLRPFDVVCVMRERTLLPRPVIERLPWLKMIASTGRRNSSIDAAAAGERGIVVTSAGYFSEPTVELTWALIHASVRDVAAESSSVRAGGWQHLVGADLAGQVLGVLGLGNIGSRVAAVGTTFGMKVIAWSENLARDRAESAGAELVSKEELFRRSDVLTVHLILSKRTKGLVGRTSWHS